MSVGGVVYCSHVVTVSRKVSRDHSPSAAVPEQSCPKVLRKYCVVFAFHTCNNYACIDVTLLSNPVVTEKMSRLYSGEQVKSLAY